MEKEMRLTEKHYSGKGYYLKCSGACPCDGMCDECDELYKAIDRLGEYEDKAEQTVDAVEVGSDPTAAGGGNREGSEWQRSAGGEPALSGEGSAGHRNRTHGQWKKTYTCSGEWLDGAGVDHNGNTVYISIDCSVCEEVFKIETHDREYWKARFKVCPFCGAKMDGDGNG